MMENDILLIIEAKLQDKTKKKSSFIKPPRGDLSDSPFKKEKKNKNWKKRKTKEEGGRRKEEGGRKAKQASFNLHKLHKSILSCFSCKSKVSMTKPSL